MWRGPSTEWHLRQPWRRPRAPPPGAGWSRAAPARRPPGSSPGRPAAPRRWAASQLVELGRRHHHQLGQHPGVGEAAVLGAEDLVAPGLVGLEPDLGVAAGERVLLQPQGRHVEGVDDVARGHQQPHRPAGRHPQHVERAGAVRVGELPHPLLALHVDVHRPLGRRVEVDELGVADGEPEQEEGQRDGDEDRLVPVARLDVGGLVGVRPAPVADHQVDQGAEDADGRDHRGEDDEEVEVVHPAGVVARLVWEEQHPAQELVHGGLCLTPLRRYAPGSAHARSGAR